MSKTKKSFTNRRHAGVSARTIDEEELVEILDRGDKYTETPDIAEEVAVGQNYYRFCLVIVVTALNEAIEEALEWQKGLSEWRKGEHEERWRKSVLSWAESPKALPFFNMLDITASDFIGTVADFVSEDRRLGITEKDIEQIMLPNIDRPVKGFTLKGVGRKLANAKIT